MWTSGIKQISSILGTFPAKLARKAASTHRRASALLSNFWYLLPAWRACRAAKTGMLQERLVVFVSPQPKGREARLAQGLAQEGWKVVLIHKDPANFDLSKGFVESQRFTGAWEALYRACSYRPAIYHVFSPSADAVSSLFVRIKPGPVVYDPTDVLPGLIGNVSRIKHRQVDCLEGADALCCRDLQVSGFRRLTGSRGHQPTILFPEHCFGKPRPPRPDAGDQIHVVSVGFIFDYVSPTGGIYPLAKHLTQNEIHLHIYPHPFLGEAGVVREKFRALLELGEGVHLHSVVKADELPSELAKYDFGLIMMPSENYYNREHFRVCGASKLTDYLEAGLGAIVSEGYGYINFVARRYTVVVGVREAMRENVRERLEKARAELRSQRRNGFNYTVEAQIPRLARFYESLSKRRSTIQMNGT